MNYVHFWTFIFICLFYLHTSFIIALFSFENTVAMKGKFDTFSTNLRFRSNGLIFEIEIRYIITIING